MKTLIACMLVVGCACKDYSKSRNIDLTFQELFKADQELLASSSKEDIEAYENDKRLRDTIFFKISHALKNSKKILFLRKVVILNNTQTGLIYVKNDLNDQLFYFKKTKNLPVIIGDGSNNFNDLAKLLEVLKSDFQKKSQELNEYFASRKLGDAPTLQVAYVDFSTVKVTKGILQFNFSPLDNSFEDNFKVKLDSIL